MVGFDQQDLACQQEDCLSRATTAFADTDVKVTSEGRPYLGAAFDTEEYIQKIVTG